ncbi:hypothetical protein [Actinomadura sp. NPDC000929]|uniref:hypothetical protein n=1 Tax=Actinomadura sp. NPDC000929 TaxID=3154517 RepID=UPI003398191A
MTWNDFAGGRAVDPATFVAAASTLLESAVAAAGGAEAARTDFIAGLEASMSTSGPYATLRLDAGLADQGVRGELRENAVAVSEMILDLVRSTSGTPGVTDIHSSCVGYAWTPPVVERLINGSGLHAARNLYNEWLWQLVLLRDALIPFTDPSQVRVLADADGLTRLQEARDWFAVQVMTRRIAHAAIVRFAAEAVTGGHAEGAYGFQHEGAVVLPPVALGGELLGPAYLLSRHEGTLVAEDTVYFVQGQEDGEPTNTLSVPPRAVGDVEVVGLTDRLVPGPPDHPVRARPARSAWWWASTATSGRPTSDVRCAATATPPGPPIRETRAPQPPRSTPGRDARCSGRTARWRCPKAASSRPAVSAR